MEIIRTESISKIYRTEEIETKALNSIDLEIERGEFVSLMGPSGCGKSTLLNVLGLLDAPTSGAMHLDGEAVGDFSEWNRARLRRGTVGFVFQSFNLIDELSVAENVALPLLYLGTRAAERRRRVGVLLDRMEISHRQNHRPQQLSGGQQQRVAIARAVVAEPPLILADEPTGNLDSRQGEKVMDLLNELHRQGTTIVMATHSQECAGHTTRTLLLRDGQIVDDTASSADGSGVR